MTIIERVTFPARPWCESSGDPTPEPQLEGRLAYPERETPHTGALLLPPHPHFGGDLDNNVIRTLGLGLSSRRHAVLAFNYRGIGASSIDLTTLEASGNGGSVHDYWHRVESETLYEDIAEDAEAARRFFVRALPAGTPLHLVGYSFGAALAALLARDLVARADEDPSCLPAGLTLVAPPLRRFPLSFLGELPIPRLLVLAAGDFLYGDREIDALQRLPAPRQVEVVDGADHFFRGREGEVLDRVDAFLECVSRSGTSAEITREEDS